MAAINSYRLSSSREPSDKMLRIWMAQVGDEVRKESEKAKQELNRRLQETIEKAKAQRGK